MDISPKMERIEMISIAIAMAVAAVPQTATTTPQGNGHHASDDRRPETTIKAKAKRKQAIEAQWKSELPVENRDADGVLMPGAPGTVNPTIPNTSSGGR